MIVAVHEKPVSLTLNCACEALPVDDTTIDLEFASSNEMIDPTLKPVELAVKFPVMTTW